VKTVVIPSDLLVLKNPHGSGWQQGDPVPSPDAFGPGWGRGEGRPTIADLCGFPAAAGAAGVECHFDHQPFGLRFAIVEHLRFSSRITLLSPSIFFRPPFALFPAYFSPVIVMYDPLSGGSFSFPPFSTFFEMISVLL
jgi:hypothetical protein